MPVDRNHALFALKQKHLERVQISFDGVRVIKPRAAFFTKRVILACPEDNPLHASLFEHQVLNERYAFDTLLFDSFPGKYVVEIICE